MTKYLYASETNMGIQLFQNNVSYLGSLLIHVNVCMFTDTIGGVRKYQPKTNSFVIPGFKSLRLQYKEIINLAKSIASLARTKSGVNFMAPTLENSKCPHTARPVPMPTMD